MHFQANDENLIRVESEFCIRYIKIKLVNLMPCNRRAYICYKVKVVLSSRCCNDMVRWNEEMETKCSSNLIPGYGDYKIGRNFEGKQ